LQSSGYKLAGIVPPGDRNVKQHDVAAYHENTGDETVPVTDSRCRGRYHSEDENEHEDDLVVS
jgi:hypothetical protein